MCAILLRPHDSKPSKWLAPFDKLMQLLFKPFNFLLDKSTGIYVLLVKLFAKISIVAILAIGCFISLNIGAFQQMPSLFLPNEDKGVLMVDVKMPQGTSIVQTGKSLKKINDIAKKIPGVKNVIAIGGFSMMTGRSENNSMVFVSLQDWSKRKTPETSINSIQKTLKEELAKEPAFSANVFTMPPIMGIGSATGAAFNIQATNGQNPFEIAETVNNFVHELSALPETMVAFSSYRADTPQLYLDVDRAKAEALNVPVSRIFNTLQSQLGSLYINDFNLYGRAYQVKIQADSSYRNQVDDIERLYVQNDKKEMVPFSSFSEVKRIIGPQVIERHNQFSSAKITAIPNFAAQITSGQLMAKIEKLAKEKLLPKGYKISWVDMSYHEKGNQNKIIGLMVLALIFGYLFLVGQYESWTVPSSVILSIAISTAGALIGLMFIRMGLDIYVQLGLVMLVGLASKNAILIVEFAKQRREEGLSIYEAAVDAAKTRYRAVLMTALSFVLGVFPLVIATGAGAASRRSIGVPVFFGMLAATTVGIIIIPGVYVFFQKFREMTHNLVKHK